MKKILLTFILVMVEIGCASASGLIKGMVVTSTGLHKRYLLSELPVIKYIEREGVKHATFFVKDVEVLSIPLANGFDFQVTYGEYLPTVTLDDKGYATYSSHVGVEIFTDGVKAYKADVKGDVVTLTPLEGYIPAGEGFLLFGENMAGSVIDFMEAETASKADVTGNKLLATTLSGHILVEKPTADVWTLGSGQQFVRYTADAFVHNRAYLTHEAPTQVSTLPMVFADDPSSIDGAVVGEAAVREGKIYENGHIYILKGGVKYNLEGQVVSF